MLQRTPLILAMLIGSAALAARAAEVADYRNGRIAPCVQEVPEEIQRRVFVEPKESIEPLVRWLVQGVTDDFQKVKILHDWIAENIAYDVESFLGGVEAGSTSWESTLRRHKSVCQGYSALLERMCQVVGIPCKVVGGYGRGYAFELSRSENVRDGNHAWNAVQVQGHWYLVDVTWDAGYFQQRSFQKRYETAYLFLAPRQFLYTHFPANPQWQLLDRPCTAEEFSRLPYLPGRFFEQGLRLATPLERFQPAGESVQFTIETPADVVVIAQLKDPADREAAKIERRTLVRREGTRSNVLATFPKAGRWNVQILSKKRQDPGMCWSAATLEFESNGGTSWLFPETYAMGDMDAWLESPLYVPLITGKPQEFKIRIHGAEQVHLRIGTKRWIPLQRTAEKDVYQVLAGVPEGAPVQILGKEVGKRGPHWTLVDFTPDNAGQ